MDPGESFESAVEAAVAYVLPYLKLYPSTVLARHDDGTVDLEPDDAPMRGQGLQSVEIMLGVPGATVEPGPGSRCLLGFLDADPSKPRVMAWAYEANNSRVALDGGTAPVARAVGDVEVVFDDPIFVQGIVSGTVTPPSGPPFELTPTPFTGTVVFVGTDPVIALIQNGAAKVLV